MTPKSTLLLLLAAGGCWLTFSSYSNGPGNAAQLDRSTSSCDGGGCHASNNNSATVVQSVTLVDVGGGTPTPAGQYIPGRTYAVSIIGNLNPANASLTHFGFQTTARNTGGNTVGSINLSGTTQLQTYSVGGRTGVEHSSKIAKNAGGFFTKTWQWTAPAAGTGKVTFYTIINAVNNNNAVTGDQPGTGVTEFSEGTVGVDDVSTVSLLAIHPNPAKDFVRIDTRGWQAGDYGISIFSSTGAVVLQQSVKHAGADVVEVKLPDLSTGLYAVRVHSSGFAQSSPLFIR